MTRIDREGHGLEATRVRPLKCVLFDWNGTLVNDVDRSWTATCRVLDSRSIRSPTITEFRTRFRLPLREWFTELGVPVTELTDVERDWNANLATEFAPLNDGAREAVELLRDQGFTLGIVSAASSAAVHHDLERLGFRNHFDLISGSADPKREAIALAARSTELPLSATAYVGDTEYDIHEAHAAGAMAIGFSGGYRPRDALVKAGADYVVGNMTELCSLVLDDAARFSKAESSHKVTTPRRGRRHELN